MCGRYALHSNPEVVALMFGLSEVPAYQPRYNIAPASQVLVIRQAGAMRGAALVRWGLVPRWAKDPSIGASMNNARAETVAEKPSFREAYRKRRCLIPANGFYEWKLEHGGKQPYYIHPVERRAVRLRRACGSSGTTCRPAPSSPPMRTRRWRRCTNACR